MRHSAIANLKLESVSLIEEVDPGIADVANFFLDLR
jgi:hypothetical protein